jgi:hypothetical protein
LDGSIELPDSTTARRKAPLLLSLMGHYWPPFSQENSQMESNIRSLVEGFVSQIVDAIEADNIRRVQDAVSVAFAGDLGTARRSRPGRAVVPAAATPGRRRPKQFCPVPGCTGVAAPVFGMVCAKHKDLSKAKIKEYRTERWAAKAAK